MLRITLGGLSQAAFWNLILAGWARGKGKLETRRQKAEEN
jgi:hypothetical protein